MRGLWFLRAQKRMEPEKGGPRHTSSFSHPVLTEHLLCASAHLAFHCSRRAEGRAGGHHLSPFIFLLDRAGGSQQTDAGRQWSLNSI